MCRCKDVTLEDIYKAIDEGFTTPEELKRRLRVGMGPCQGRTCMRIIVGILARKTGEKPEKYKYTRVRPPIRPIPIGLLTVDENEED